MLHIKSLHIEQWLLWFDIQAMYYKGRLRMSTEHGPLALTLCCPCSFVDMARSKEYLKTFAWQWPK